jgi:AbrB family looped-hinge helix DNA binding protein
MVVVTRKYQVTIPEEVREDLGIGVGDEIVFVKGADGKYRLMTVDELTREGCELCKDIEETIKESRKGFGKGVLK